LSPQSTNKIRNLLFALVSAVFLAVACVLLLPYVGKVAVLGAVIAFCVLVFFAVHRFTERKLVIGHDPVIDDTVDPGDRTASIFTLDVQERLLALEEIGEYFGTTLKPADMLRLVTNRIEELIAFDGCFLFLLSENGDTLKIVHAAGKMPSRFMGLMFDSKDTGVGLALSSPVPFSDHNFSFSDKILPQHFKQTIASSISYDGKKLGVIALSSEAGQIYRADALLLLQAIGERISGLVSMAYNNQRNSESSYKTMVTDMPNEAAFYLILEQQLAEAQRNPEKHVLTVLCMDIRDFKGVNNDYGYGVGDQVLVFAARLIKNQLRQMDFLAHPSSDEFWACLPTATAEIVEMVVRRLDRACMDTPFELPSGETIELQLNFGTATFKKDGLIANDLVKRAMQRKNEEKQLAAGYADSVLPFPAKAPQTTDHPY
jgi:diguanylate cyclase (GGDEF)-like protein